MLPRLLDSTGVHQTLSPGYMQLHQGLHVAETCVKQWSASSIRPGRRGDCTYPQGQALPLAEYAPQGQKGQSLHGKLTRKLTKDTSASMQSLNMRYAKPAKARPERQDLHRMYHEA